MSFSSNSNSNVTEKIYDMSGRPIIHMNRNVTGPNLCSIYQTYTLEYTHWSFSVVLSYILFNCNKTKQNPYKFAVNINVGN